MPDTDSLPENSGPRQTPKASLHQASISDDRVPQQICLSPLNAGSFEIASNVAENSSTEVTLSGDRPLCEGGTLKGES